MNYRNYQIQYYYYILINEIARSWLVSKAY